MTKKSLLTDLISLIDPKPSNGNDTQNQDNSNGALNITLVDLILVSCSFLRKLTVYHENKDTVRSTAIIERLHPYLPCSHPPVTNAILRLLFNLSFDKVSLGFCLFI